MLGYREATGPHPQGPHSLTSNHSGIDIGSDLDGLAAVLGVQGCLEL